MKIFLSLFLLAASVAHANNPALKAPLNRVPTSAAAFDLDNYFGPVAFKHALGTRLLQAHNTAVGTYDVSVQGGGIGNYNLGIRMPAKAIIKKAWFNCPTLPVSTGGTGATIAVNLLTGGDLKTATVARSWTALTDGQLDGTTVANYLKTTNDTEIVLTIASSTLSAGKIKAFVDYVVSE